MPASPTESTKPDLGQRTLMGKNISVLTLLSHSWNTSKHTLRSSLGQANLLLVVSNLMNVFKSNSHCGVVTPISILTRCYVVSRNLRFRASLVTTRMSSHSNGPSRWINPRAMNIILRTGTPNNMVLIHLHTYHPPD